MRRIGRTVLCSLALALAVSPCRADGDPPPEPDARAGDWRGLYIGYHSGGGLGLAEVDNPLGPSLYGDTIRTPGPLAGAQLGYNWQSGRTVLGLEADASWVDFYGTDTCLAFSGFFVSANCRVQVDALGTVTGRAGWALGTAGSTLLYGKAGVAWEYATLRSIASGGFGFPGTSTSGLQWGWTLGAGAEQALGPRWSIRAEYDYLSFDDNLATPPSGFQTAPPGGTALAPVGSTGTDVEQDVHLFKVGVNYRPGDRGLPSVHDLDLMSWSAPAGWSATVGARYVHGWGRFQKDLGIQGLGLASLASRLTYDDMNTDGAELTARLDTPYKVMVKGLVGGGAGGGHLNDEDWGIDDPTIPVFIPYSNTLSEVDNDVRYAIADVGYVWWRDGSSTVASFIGYSYFKQEMRGYGCFQFANQNSDCVPPIPVSTLGITENDTWQSLRLGTAVDVELAPRIRLLAEGAYLPYVRFTGTDNHILRSLVSPEEANGTGVQLEAMLTYALTDALSVGVGGRYWSMWTSNGEVNFGGTGLIIPMRYAAEQAAVLLQGSYRFGADPEVVPLK